MIPFYFFTLLLSWWLSQEAYLAMTVTTGGYDIEEINNSHVLNFTEIPPGEVTQFLNLPEDDVDINNQVLNGPPTDPSLFTVTVSTSEENDGNNLLSPDEELLTKTVESSVENVNCLEEGTCTDSDTTHTNPEIIITTVYSHQISMQRSSTTLPDRTETNPEESLTTDYTNSATLENHIPVESPKAKENIVYYYSIPESEFKENVSISPIRKMSDVSKTIFSESTVTSSANAFHRDSKPLETSIKPVTNYSTKVSWNDTVSTEFETQSIIVTDSSTITSSIRTEHSTDVRDFSDLKSILSNFTKSLNPVVSPSPDVIPFDIINSTVKPQTEKSMNVTKAMSTSSEGPLDDLIKDFGQQSTSPRPKLTNPTCTMLPVCVRVRVVSEPPMCLSSYDERILKAFRSFIAETLAHYAKPPIYQSQIIMELHPCSALLLGPSSTTFFFVTDSSGEYEEVLTTLAGILLKRFSKSPATTKLPLQVMEADVLGMNGVAGEVLAVTPPPIVTTHSGMVAAVAISAVAGACLCLLCVLLLVMKHRLAAQQPQQCSQTINNYSLDSFSINASFRRRPAGGLRSSSFMNHAFIDDENETASKPMSGSALATVLNQRKNVLEREFERIPMNMHKLDEVPPGAECKNRYANVVPNPQTRVQLSDKSDDPVKSYINANYVKGHGGRQKFYIACQAPLSEYTGDFWRMVWEQQSRLILMLTLLQENGVSRCTAYFPENTLDCRQLHGNYEVSLLKKDVREFYTASTLKLYDIEKKLFREVLHLWYKAWPSPDASSLVAYLLQARPYTNCNPGPTIVHCSAGTGRTGVILAIDICMREYDTSRSLDVVRCVSRLRIDRGGAVQNAEQYLLIHEALLEYVSLASNQSNRPSVCSNS